jgi:hypothetical protein
MKTLVTALICVIGLLVGSLACLFFYAQQEYRKALEYGKAKGFQLGYAEGHRDADQFWTGVDPELKEKMWSDQIE